MATWACAVFIKPHVFCEAALVSGLGLLCSSSHLRTLLLSAPLLQGPRPSLTYPREQLL